MSQSVNKGASIQPKDGRKGKKKKDFSKKDNGGSDMDAFIDGKRGESVESKPPLPPSAAERSTSAEKSPPVQEAKPVFSYAAAATNAEKKEQSPPVSSVDKKPVDAENKTQEANKSPDLNQNQTKEKSPTPVVIIEPTPAQDASEPASSQETVPEPVKEFTKAKSPEITVEMTSETKASVNDENLPPEKSEESTPPVESKMDVQVVPKVTRDENGRLVYDRSYLMELRGTEKSQARPVNLPDLEIILDTPMQTAAVASKRGSSMTGPDFTPSFFQTGVGGQRHAPIMGKSNSRGRPGPGDRDSMGRMGPPQKIITRQSMGNDVKPLHQAEKPWVPSVKNKTEVDKDAKSLEQETLFIMNRLTPTNFERLAGEMRKLKVTTYEHLQELVKIFFDKVTIETKFVSAYAQLCKVMAQLKVPPPPGLKESQATFRVVMLTKCQQEFEADKTVVFEDPEKKRKELEAEIAPDTPKRKDQIDFTLYQMKLRRLKFYGNIRFIGELFKLGMLTENIMHDCIFRLLKARDDDSLLSLCNLVTTVGKHLDTEKAKARMDQYFAQMTKIAEERKSRIKFTLKDVLELRSNHWVPRKGETGPKKIDEVHKDFEQEQATKQFLNNQPPPPRNDNPQQNRRNSKQRQDEKPPADDGWNTVGSRTMKLDPGKMRLSKPSAVDENSIQLGPGGGMKFGMWSRGSFGGSSQPASQDERQPAPNNRFNALRDDKGRQFERSPSRENNGRGMRQGSQGHSRGKMSRSSQEGERRDLLASARSIVGGPRSQNSSRDNSWNREDRRQTFGPRSSHERDNPMTRSDITPRPSEEFRTPAPPTPIKKIKEMSEEEMESKAKNILQEYLNIRDLAEAKLCVSELAGQPRLYMFVTASLNDVLEKRTTDRELTGKLLNELIKSNNISLDIYTKGLKEVTMYAEDMVIDIPQMWLNLAQLITPLLIGGSISMLKVVSVLSESMDKRCTAILLAQIMLQVKEKSGEDSAAQMWQSSGSNWADFIPSAEVNNFLKDKKIEFVSKSISGGSSLNQDDGNAIWQKLSGDIEAMIRGGKSNGDITSFIEKTVRKENRSKDFIRALTTAVTSSSINPPPNAPKANEDIIKARKDILQRYIQSDPKLELQALYAIQALMTKLEHPSGVISCLFDTLYDEEVISEESCKQWEKSNDPAEQKGKGVCSMQLTQFFTWLSENDEIENS